MWPTNGWQKSKPEAQGIDSGALAQLYDHLVSGFPALRQLTIVRHGYIVFDRENRAARESLASVVFRHLLAAWGALFHCPPETFRHTHRGRWNLRSATKSVTSILVGMALADRAIDHLDQPVAEFLPEELADPAKRGITLRHLLTMTSGLASVEGGAAAFKMLASPNWTRYMARLPLVSQPGEQFLYNSANAHLLSAAISNATGQSLTAYANQRLFGPLGIHDVRWGAGPEGVTFGGGNLFLSSQELAKIGLLCLRGGRWEDRQLVSPAWIAESLQAHQVYYPGWNYGYYWYLHDELDERRQRWWLTFSAAGSGGQKLLVVPELDLIMAAVAKTDFVGEKGMLVNQAVAQFLIPTVRVA
jgi:CubicO group peptidase (beta-lactamase class C family)